LFNIFFPLYDTPIPEYFIKLISLAPSPTEKTPPKLVESKTLGQETADIRYKDAKDYYLAAVKKAKETPRSYMPETKDPGFAQNPSSIYLPKAVPSSEKK